MGAFLFWAHRGGIRTRKGAELRKREAFSSAAREERSDEARRGRRSRTRTSLIAHHLIEKAPSDGGLSFLGPVHGIRTQQHVCHKGRGQKMVKMSTAILLTTYKKTVFA